VDPIAKEYPELTVYQFASNRPIEGVDLDGLEYIDADWAKNVVKNEDGSFQLQVGPKVIHASRVATAGDKIFYDIGKHLYVKDKTFSEEGIYRDQITEATLVGYQLFHNIKNLPECAPSFKEATATDFNGSYDNANACKNPGGMCFAVTMARINKAYADLGEAEVLNKKGEDVQISGNSNVAKFKDPSLIGYGVGAALSNKNLGTLVSDADIWQGKLQRGAALQYWQGVKNYSDLVGKLKKGPVGGHSGIFTGYKYDDDGNIKGLLFRDYKGLRVFSKNDAKDKQVLLFGANLKDQQ
jgi:hypothetical protein